MMAQRIIERMSQKTNNDTIPRHEHQTNRSSPTEIAPTAVSDIDIDFLASTTSSPSEKLQEIHRVTPEKKAFLLGEGNPHDGEDQGGQEILFEPYYDTETSRKIMRMRMGSLMDFEVVDEEDTDNDNDGNDEDDDEEPLLSIEAQQKDHPLWTIFDKATIDGWSTKASHLFSLPSHLFVDKTNSRESLEMDQTQNENQEVTIIDKDGCTNELSLNSNNTTQKNRDNIPYTERESSTKSHAFFPNTKPSTVIRIDPEPRPISPGVHSAMTSSETAQNSTKTPTKPTLTAILHECIEDQLVMYSDMISSKSIDDIKVLLQQDSRFSERETAAFVMGLRHNPQNNKGSESEQGISLRTCKAIGPSGIMATPSTSLVSPRMRARASKRSVTMDDSMSNLMAIVKSNTISSTPSELFENHNDARTSISVRSTLSCRELSIQRLQRRIASSRKKEETKVTGLLKDLQEAQSRQKRLEAQLSKAGIRIAEDIPYDVAKLKVSSIAQEMQAIGHSQVKHPDTKIQSKLRQKYFVLEQEMEKYMSALELTDEYLKERENEEKKFDHDNAKDNTVALEKLWRHMPVNIRQKSVEEWLTIQSPSGKILDKRFLVKFSRTNILTLLRMNPSFVARGHPSNLEQMRVTGLTLTERRALEAYLQPIAQKHWRNSKDALTKRKWSWYCILRQTFKDHLTSYKQHEAKFGIDRDGVCLCDALKCPVKANQKLSYSIEDYGFPCDISSPVFEEVSQTGKARIVKTSSAVVPKKPSAKKNLLAEISSKASRERTSMPTPQKSCFLQELQAQQQQQKQERIS